MPYPEMSPDFKAEPPKCSRCNRPNAAYRIDIKPVCEFCVTTVGADQDLQQGVVPMTEVETRFKGKTRAKRGLKARLSRRARPDEPLAEYCEARTPTCTGRPAHRHHVQLRKQGGTDDASNTLDVCTLCHVYIHAHPAISYERGWLKRRGS